MRNRKLTLRREVLAELAPEELLGLAGADDTVSRQDTICAGHECGVSLGPGGASCPMVTCMVTCASYMGCTVGVECTG